jgi:hypothetical protein
LPSSRRTSSGTSRFTKVLSPIHNDMMILHLDCYFCFVSADLVFPVCLGQRLKGVLAATPRNLFIPDLSQEWLLQNAALIGVRGRKRWRPCHMKVVNFCLSRECKQSCVLFVEFMPQSTLSCCEAMFRTLNERNLSLVYIGLAIRNLVSLV